MVRLARLRFRQWLLSPELLVIASLAFGVTLRAEEKPSIVVTVIRAAKLFDPHLAGCLTLLSCSSLEITLKQWAAAILSRRPMRE